MSLVVMRFQKHTTPVFEYVTWQVENVARSLGMPYCQWSKSSTARHSIVISMSHGPCIRSVLDIKSPKNNNKIPGLVRKPRTVRCIGRVVPIFFKFSQQLIIWCMMLKQIPVTVCHNQKSIKWRPFNHWAKNVKSRKSLFLRYNSDVWTPWKWVQSSSN